MGRRNQRRIKAKICPFCGYGWIEVYESVYGGFFVECQECGATVGNPDREEFAIESWNNRVQTYNQINIKVGDKRFCVCKDYPKYIVQELTCTKISKHNDNATNYTFTGNYKTWTFKTSSFGKKVFEDFGSAQSTASILNKNN